MLMRTASSIFLLALLLSSAAGCFLFNKKTPQQEYTEALMRGNSMQASQVWLNMSPEDRMKFARGEGFKPDDSTQKDVQQMMMNHSNQSGEESQEQMPTPLGASLKELPATELSSPNN
jgi:hypothetical protein